MLQWYIGYVYHKSIHISSIYYMNNQPEKHGTYEFFT